MKLLDHFFHLNEFEQFEKCINELCANPSIVNTETFITLRTFLQQIMVLNNLVKESYIELVKNSTFEVYEQNKYKLKLEDSIIFFERTYLKIIKRYFFTELHLSTEQLFKDYIDSNHEIKIRKIKGHNEGECKYNGCCFLDKETKPIGLTYLIDQILKHKKHDKKSKKYWRSLFEVLRVIRNRTGHSNKNLTGTHDEKIIIDSNFDGVGIEDGSIHIRFTFMKFAIQEVSKFCIKSLLDF